MSESNSLVVKAEDDVEIVDDEEYSTGHVYDHPYWSHRVVKDEGAWLVSEVYFDAQDRPWGYCEASASYRQGADTGDPIESLKTQLARMVSACDKPVLDWATDFTHTPTVQI